MSKLKYKFDFTDRIKAKLRKRYIKIWNYKLNVLPRNIGSFRLHTKIEITIC